MSRPVPVTVVCWVIIALSAEAILAAVSGVADASVKEALHTASSHLSLSTALFASSALLMLSMALSVLMLRGANWARIAYISLLVILLLAQVAHLSRHPLAIVILTVAKLSIFGAILFRPESNSFFIRSQRTVTANPVA